MDKTYAAIISGIFLVLTTIVGAWIKRKFSQKKKKQYEWDREKILKHFFFLDIHIVNREIFNTDLGHPGRTKLYHDVTTVTINSFIDKTKEFIMSEEIDNNEDFLHKTQKILSDGIDEIQSRLKDMGFNKESGLDIVLYKIHNRSHFRQKVVFDLVAQIANCSLHKTPTEKFYIFLYVLSQQLYYICSFAALEIKHLNGEITGKEYQGLIL